MIVVHTIDNRRDISELPIIIDPGARREPVLISDEA